MISQATRSNMHLELVQLRRSDVARRAEQLAVANNVVGKVHIAGRGIVLEVRVEFEDDALRKLARKRLHGQKLGEMHAKLDGGAARWKRVCLGRGRLIVA